MSKRTRRTTPPAGGGTTARSGGAGPQSGLGGQASRPGQGGSTSQSGRAGQDGRAGGPGAPGTPPGRTAAADAGSTITAAGAGTAAAAARGRGPDSPALSGSASARRTAARAGGTSSSAAGTPRAGRRPQRRTYQRSFFERYRSLIVGGGILGGLLLFGAFVFLGSTGTAYACEQQIDPVAVASPGPSGTPQLGQVIPDMGIVHVNPGTQARYTSCPPASGAHYNIAGRGPIAPRFYGPDSNAEPQGWVHNLEHGGYVILYSCAGAGGCNQADLDRLRALASNFPASPICNIAGGVISPVIARFDTMKARYAGLVWNRGILQDALNVDELLAFFQQWGERNAPERQCAAPTPSPSVSFDASASPAASGSPATNSAPSPSGSPASS